MGFHASFISCVIMVLFTLRVSGAGGHCPVCLLKLCDAF